MRSVIELLATTLIVRLVGYRRVRLPEGWVRREVEGGTSVIQKTMIGLRSIKGVAVHMIYSEKKVEI